MQLFATIQGAAAAGLVLAAAAAAAAEMPPLPESIAERGVVRLGVKCDYPPDGYLDMSGNPVGIEVNVGRQIAAYAFGSPDKAELTCVTSSNRVPTLVGDRVDLVIATMGITPERAEVVDFSKPYAWGASSVLVMNESDVTSLADLEGRTVVFVKGAWQIPWFENNLPGIQDIRLDTVSDALQSLMQGRADAYAHDVAVQLSLDKNNPRIRLLEDRYQIGVRGIAVRKGEAEWLAYVNAALDRMQEEGLVAAWIEEHDDPAMVEVRTILWDVSQMPKED